MDIGSRESMTDFSFAIIDFEASCLDENSYPIEVGLATWREGVFQSWSSLIRPAPEWSNRDAWSKRSERIHGISRDMLTNAPSIADVVARLEKQATGFRTIYCDGGSYDQHWLRELFAPVGLTPTFKLANMEALVGADDWDRFSTILEAGSAPHRAGADALRLAQAAAAARFGF